MPAPLELVSVGPHESVRTDFLSLTFMTHSEDGESDLLAYCWDLAEKVLPTGQRFNARPAKHYAVSYSHGSGVTLEMSPHDSARSTRGTASISLSGRVWGSLDAHERNLLITDLARWPGFQRCTRWDPQITVLNPKRTISQIVNDVEAGRIWVAGFSQQNPWGQRKASGEFAASPTQYFGSPESNIRIRMYDHGAKHGWDVSSLRVEAQIRKRYANDHFIRLARRCKEQANTDPLFIAAEERTVKDALAQHADIRDTSRWEGRQRPTKWRQSAPVADWWEDMLKHKGDPAKLSHRPEVSYDRARVSCQNQYGRKLVKGWLAEMVKGGLSLQQVMFIHYLECSSHLQQLDLLELLALCETDQEREQMRRLFHLSIEQAESWEDFQLEN